MGGKRGRRRIATIERGVDVGAGNGIGLALDEVKGLLERLQGIVAAEHAQEVVSANSSCGACGLELPRKGMAGSSIAPRSSISGFRARGCTRSAGAVHVRMTASPSIRSRWSWQNGPTLNCCALDWFHISMRFEHVLQRLRGLRKTERATADVLLARVESAKWRLWHGRAAGCLEQLQTVLPQTSDGLKTRLAELIDYLGRNRERLVDYGTRHRSGLPISTSMAESAVESVVGDRVKKNRKMRWTPKGGQCVAAHSRGQPQR